MDREKLIEARSKFIRDNRALIGNNAPLVADAFEACAEAIMKMPISERLTEGEKEQLRWYYNHKYWDRSIVSNPELMTKSNKGRLVGIFGSDLFKNK